MGEVFPKKEDGETLGVNDAHWAAFLRNAKGEIARRGRSSLLSELTNGTALIDPNGTLIVAELVRLVGGNFIDGVALLSHIWTEVFDNGGTTATTDGELILETNTTANGRARVQSFRSARFITATFNISHQAMSCPNHANLNVRRSWGCYDPTAANPDGVYFENLEGVISLNRVKSGIIEDTVLQADFNGDAPYLLDSNIHVYEIIYNAGTIFFLQDRKLIHRMSSLDSAAYSTPHLKVGHDIENINGNTVANTLVSRGSSISRMGSNQALADFFTIAAIGTFVIKNTPGRLHRILITDQSQGQASVIVYNNLAGSGEIIAPINPVNVQGTLEFEVEFDVGLTVVVTGSNIGITVIYD